MSDASPPSSQLPPTGGSSSAPFIVVGIVLVAAMGGLVCWKMKSDTPPPAPSATVAVTSEAPRPRMDAPPPPPTDDPPTASSSPTAKKPVGTGGPVSACGDCSGSPGGSTRGDVQAKAGAARGCYERALRANPNLQGQMRVNLVVDANGLICSAGISNDSVGAGDVSSCVLSLFRGAKVGAPTGGCVAMSVPLNFQPKNK